MSNSSVQEKSVIQSQGFLESRFSFFLEYWERIFAYAILMWLCQSVFKYGMNLKDPFSHLWFMLPLNAFGIILFKLQTISNHQFWKISVVCSGIVLSIYGLLSLR